jgi:hypothetical protein
MADGVKSIYQTQMYVVKSQLNSNYICICNNISHNIEATKYNTLFDDRIG